MKTYDLIVVGGGFSGVCAAIAAARGGASVLLCEASNALGGAPATCLVNPFMPYTTTVDGELKFLSRGIFEEIANALVGEDTVKRKKQATCFDEEQLKLILNRMTAEAGVELLFHTTLFSVERKENKIESLTFATVAGPLTLSAKYYVDATGDGTLSKLAGCPFTLGREKDHLCQPMTLCFRLAGVDKAVAFPSGKKINELWKAKLAKGELRNPREDVLKFDTVHEGIMHLNTTRVVKLDPTDPFDVTKAEIEAREQVAEVVDFLKNDCAEYGFANCKLLSTAMNIGVRESRMIHGEHLLTELELKNCTRFEDSIATGNYDIDIHNPEGTGTSHYYFKPGEYYTIPYRSLIPVGMENLLVAGRCISATHEAQASIRIMPIVATLGEAAGWAISLCVKENLPVKDVSIKELHEVLSKNNFSF